MPPNDYKASGILLSHWPIKQPPRSSKTPAGPAHSAVCVIYPGEAWQMDFTQRPVSQGYKYLVVMIGTFTGWIEVFPTWTEKVVKILFREIILRFGQPRSLQSDNGTYF